MDEDKCQQCGAPALPDAKYCEQCGAQLHAEVEQTPQSVPPYTPAPTYQAPSYAAETPYEGVPIRFVAALIDAVIIFIIAGILAIPFQNQLSGAVSLLIFLLYFIVLEGMVRPDGRQDGRQDQSREGGRGEDRLYGRGRA